MTLPVLLEIIIRESDLTKNSMTLPNLLEILTLDFDLAK
jgi:hypothetical protein